MRNILLAIALALSIGEAQAQQPPITTAQAKQILLAHKSRLWRDPDSVAEAKIGAPYVCPTGGACVCVEANARNAYGGYAGLTRYVVKFEANSFQILGQAGPYAKCEGFTAWPEMNGTRTKSRS